MFVSACGSLHDVAMWVIQTGQKHTSTRNSVHVNEPPARKTGAANSTFYPMQTVGACYLCEQYLFTFLSFPYRGGSFTLIGPTAEQV